MLNRSMKVFVAELHERHKDWEKGQYDTTRLGIFTSEEKAKEVCLAEKEEISEDHWFWVSVSVEVLDKADVPSKIIMMFDNEGNPIKGPLLECPIPV